MKLEDYSIDQLRNEINRRNYTTPKVLINPDFTTLVDYLLNLVTKLNKDESNLPKNFESEVFRLAMDTVFGYRNWKDWWNEKVR